MGNNTSKLEQRLSAVEQRVGGVEQNCAHLRDSQAELATQVTRTLPSRLGHAALTGAIANPQNPLQGAATAVVGEYVSERLTEICDHTGTSTKIGATLDQGIALIPKYANSRVAEFEKGVKIAKKTFKTFTNPPVKDFSELDLSEEENSSKFSILWFTNPFNSNGGDESRNSISVNTDSVVLEKTQFEAMVDEAFSNSALNAAMVNTAIPAAVFLILYGICYDVYPKTGRKFENHEFFDVLQKVLNR